jgi:hypothetical protein
MCKCSYRWNYRKQNENFSVKIKYRWAWYPKIKLSNANVFFFVTKLIFYHKISFFIPENKINLYKTQNKIMKDEIMPRNHVQNIMKLESYAHVID